MRPDVAHDANIGFLVFFGPAQDEFLFGRKFVLRKDAGAVKAKEDGTGVLGKTRPSRSEPIRTMGISLGMCPLLRIS